MKFKIGHFAFILSQKFKSVTAIKTSPKENKIDFTKIENLN